MSKLDDKPTRRFLKAKNSAKGIEIFKQKNLLHIVAHYTENAITERIITIEKIKSLTRLSVEKISHRRGNNEISIDLSGPGDSARLNFSPPIKYFYNLVIVSKRGLMNLLNNLLFH